MEKISLRDLFSYVTEANYKISQFEMNGKPGPRSELLFQSIHASLLNMIKLLTPEQKKLISPEMKEIIQKTLKFVFLYCGKEYRSANSVNYEPVHLDALD